MTGTDLARLLYLEDDPADVELVLEILAREQPGWQITVARDRSSFEAALKANKPDLLITDYSLPDFDGLRAMEAVRSVDPLLPVIVLSGTIGDEKAAEVILNGASDYVLKGNVSNLPTAVQRALAKSRQALAAHRAELLLKSQSAAIAAAADGIMIADPDGTMFWLNNAFATLNGYTPEELLGKNPRILNSGKNPPGFFERLWSTVLSGKTWRAETINRRKDGSDIIVDQTITPVLDKDGKLVSLVAIHNDISARKAAEEGLRRSRDRLRILFDNAPEAYFLVAEGSRFIDVNLAAEALTGHSRDELLRHTLFSIGFLHPDSVQKAQALEATPPNKGTPPAEFRVIRRDGQLRDVEVTRHATVFDDERAVLAMVRDVTEAKQQKQALQEALQFQEMIISSISAAILVLTPAGSVRFASPQIKAISGHAAANLSGLQLLEVVAPASRRRLLRAFMFASKRNRTRWTDAQLTRSDGRDVFVRVVFSPMPLENESLIVATIEDVTAVRQARIQMAQTGKMAMLGEMAAGVAHEINQPLSVIRLSAEMQQEEADAGNENPPDLAFIRERADKIMRMSDRALEILQNLRLFARGGDPNFRPMNVNDAVVAALELIREKARLAGVQIRTELGEQLPRISGQANQLGQVIVNMVINAIDALKESTVVLDRTISIRTEQTGNGHIQLTISDNGPGIAPTVIDRIFEPFFSTKEVGKGTGLGLSISFGIIESHGGSVQVENAQTGGAIFTMRLPALDP